VKGVQMAKTQWITPIEEFEWAQVGDAFIQRGIDDMPVFDIAWYAAGQMPSHVKINGIELPGVEAVEIKGVVGRPLKVMLTFVAGKFNVTETEQGGPDANSRVHDRQ